MPRSAYQFQTIRSEGAILPPDLLHKIAAGEVEGLAPEAYHLPPGVKLKEAISQSWTRLLAHWRDFRRICTTLGEHDETGTISTREKWLLPLLNELGYGRLPTSKAPEIDGKTYAIDRFYNHVPIHLIGFRLPLDRRTKGARGAATASPHSLLQEYLNRGEPSLWGILSNGLQLRILRDSKALSRQSFVEFDLESMFEGENYADFAVLWMIAHQSRVESEKAIDCWLEKWSKLSHVQGTRILSALRDGVTKTIEILGRGFVGHPRNEHLRGRLRKGDLSTLDFYRQLLRTVYRLLFLFVAEDRGLLHPRDAAPEACDIYDRYFSTRRLRELSERMRGSKHGDLWHSLSLVFDKLNRPDGCRELGLPVFGSFLWSTSAVPDLLGPAPKGAEPVPSAVQISNEELLSAVRALAFTEDNRVLRAVDYGSLGSEELGSVYESLLELHPEVIAGNTADSSSFELRTAAGNERKTSGSYYTPDSLVQCLLDSALEPVVADTLERTRKGSDGKPLTGDVLRASQEKALLALKVCDPACGSGHFLIAAAHRIGAHLARVRGGEVEPSPAEYQHAVRDVISHCIFGVDINPMAVELCKVALWMEALEPGKPLSFLDHRIQCGNSLLGVTPALLAKGIPDEAFTPIEGDDKEVCKQLKKRNKDERTGAGAYLFDIKGEVMPWDRLGNVTTALVSLNAIDDNTIDGVQQKQKRWEELVRSGSYLSGRLLADDWCAAFVWKKTRDMGDAITESVFRRIERNPHDLTPWMRDEIQRVAVLYQFFHWHLAFPDVFRVPGSGEHVGNEQAGWSGGFDVVLGNPPWERTAFEEVPYFSSRVASIAEAPTTAARQRLITNLSKSHPELYDEYVEDRRKAEAEDQFFALSGRYPYSSGGRTNTYALFADLFSLILESSGRSGVVIPTGIATDAPMQAFWNSLCDQGRVRSLYDFENRGLFFPHVHSSYKFCLLTLTGASDLADATDYGFFLDSPEVIARSDVTFSMTQREIAALNPETRQPPVCPTRCDFELLLKLQTSGPPVGLHFSAWVGLTSAGTSESWLQSHEHSTGDRSVVTMHEAKMIHQFDHRFATYEAVNAEDRRRGRPVEADNRREAPSFFAEPRFLVPQALVHDHLVRKTSYTSAIPAYRDVARSTDERTMIATVLPFSGLMQPLNGLSAQSAQHALLGVACMNSLSMDFVARLKTPGIHLNVTICNQLPFIDVLRLSAVNHWDQQQTADRWIGARAMELVYTAWDLQEFAKDCYFAGPPFRWNEYRRFLLRAELDAAFFHFYLCTPHNWQKTGSPELLRNFPTPRHAVEYILETFPIVKRKDEAKYGSYRTKETILSIYDEMTEVIAANEAAVAAGKQPIATYKSRLDPLPGPPADPAGNFLPLPEWKPGQPRPANWPRHIHAPREVHEWALANSIDWRSLLEPTPQA